MPHVKGSLWSREKNTHSEWLAQLKIRISGPGHIGGEGFAFWYTKDRGAPPYILAEKYPASVDPSGHALGPVYGALDQWNGLAVMFDTFDEKTGRVKPSFDRYTINFSNIFDLNSVIIRLF